MPVLRFLNVELKLLGDNFNNGIKAAQKEAKELDKTIKPMKEVAKDLGTAMSAAGLAVVGSMTAMAKAAANYGDELNDATQRTGLSVQELAKLKFAAEQSGASFGDVTTGLRILSRNLVEASEGSKTQARAFKDIGIAVTDSTGKIRPMNDVLLDLSDRFAGMEDGAEKSAIAVELLGRGGTALIPTLNAGRGGLKDMGDMAQRLGLVISGDVAKAGDEFNDMLEEVKGATLGLSIAIGQAILPSLTDLAAKVRDVIIDFKDFAREHQVLTDAVFKLAGVFSGSGALMLGLAGLATVLPRIATALTTVSGIIGPWGIALTVAAGAVFAFREEIRKFLQEAIAGSVERIGMFTGAMADIGDKLHLPTSMLRAASVAANEWADRLQKSARAIRITGEAVEETKPPLKTYVDGSEAAAKAAKEWAAHIKDLNEQLAKEQQRLAGLKLAELLDKATFAIRTNNNEMAQWLRSLDDGTAANDRLVQSLHKNIDAFGETSGSLVDIGRKFDTLTGKSDATAANVTADWKGVATDTQKAAKEMSAAMSTAMGNITADFARAFTDIIFEGKKFGEGMIGIAKAAAKGMMDAFLVGLLSPLTSQLAGLGKTAADAIGGLLGIGGGAAGAATSAAGGAASAAGSAGSTASSIAGAVSSFTPMGIISAGISAIGSLGTIMQLKRIEGTMNAVEYNTRASEIQLRLGLEQVLWPIHGLVQGLWGFSHDQIMILDAIYNKLSEKTQGITLAPVYATTVNVHGFSDNMAALVRDQIEPPLMKDYEKNTNGILEQLRQLLASAGPAIVSR